MALPPRRLNRSPCKAPALPRRRSLSSSLADRSPAALKGLGEGLEALTAKLDPASAKAADVVTIRMLESTRNKETFVIYAELSAELMSNQSRDQQVTRIFHLLCHPLTAGDATKNLLALLERVQGIDVRFNGDLWKAIEWAETEHKAGRLSGLDLDAPMHVP
jgi:hypothetical protein